MEHHPCALAHRGADRLLRLRSRWFIGAPRLVTPVFVTSDVERPDFFFCAYHSSVTFKGVGHVLYTVEPFQNGCQVRPGTPNGQLVDSTNNVLSHELIETITDPDGTAWWNSTNNGLFGEEIADECSFLTPDFFFDPTTFQVSSHVYATQPEYSNQDHACAIRP